MCQSETDAQACPQLPDSCSLSKHLASAHHSPPLISSSLSLLSICLHLAAMDSGVQLFLHFPVSTPAGWSLGTSAAWAELELGLGLDHLRLEVPGLPAGTSDHSSAPPSRAGTPATPLGAEMLGVGALQSTVQSSSGSIY